MSMSERCYEHLSSAQLDDSYLAQVAQELVMSVEESSVAYCVDLRCCSVMRK